MSSTPVIHQLVDEAAGGLDVQLMANEDQDAWLLAFDDETTFDIEYDASDDRLVITGDIGEIAEPARLRIYEILLQYTHLWTQTGGIRMALDGTSGHAAMMVELPTANLDPSRLASTLTKLAGIQRAWRQILHETSKAPSEGRAAAHLILKP